MKAPDWYRKVAGPTGLRPPPPGVTAKPPPAPPEGLTLQGGPRPAAGAAAPALPALPAAPKAPPPTGQQPGLLPLPPPLALLPPPPGPGGEQPPGGSVALALPSQAAAPEVATRAPPGRPAGLVNPAPRGQVVEEKSFLIPGLQSRPYTEEELHLAFEMIDLDRHGKLGPTELLRALSLCGEEDTTDAEVSEMIRLYDPDGNGSVDFSEFISAFKDPPPLFRNFDLQRQEMQAPVAAATLPALPELLRIYKEHKAAQRAKQGQAADADSESGEPGAEAKAAEKEGAAEQAEATEVVAEGAEAAAAEAPETGTEAAVAEATEPPGEKAPAPGTEATGTVEEGLGGADTRAVAEESSPASALESPTGIWESVDGSPETAVPPVPAAPAGRLKLNLAAAFGRGAACACCAEEEEAEACGEEGCPLEGGEVRIEFGEEGDVQMEYGEDGDAAESEASFSPFALRRSSSAGSRGTLRLPALRVAASSPTPCLERRASEIPTLPPIRC